jgi:hypothetical protein
VHTIAKITPDDYSDLLAAVDEGVPQRELARRYGCAPSLIARHVAKARRLRELRELEQVAQADRSNRPIEGSMREILEARIRDPKTPARDLASLSNALARLIADEPTPETPSFPFRSGTLILEPGPRSRGSERGYRLLVRAGGRIEYLSGRDYDQSAVEALWQILVCFAPELGLSREELLGLSPGDGSVPIDLD